MIGFRKQPGSPWQSSGGGFFTVALFVLGIVFTDQTPLIHASSGDLTGLVFEDNGIGGGVARDGVQNGDEAALAGLTVTLQNDAGGAPETMVTDVAGNYSFHEGFDDSYTITITTPTGWTNTLVTTGALIQNSGLFELPSTMPTVGIFHEITIAGKVFFDTNHVSYQDGSEKPMPYITASLHPNSSYTLVMGSEVINPDLVNPVSVDRNGNYSFALTEPGDYWVGFSNVPDNYQFSVEHTTNPLATSATNSDVNESGNGEILTYAYGTEQTHIDAGAFMAPAVIGNYIWSDTNHDGIQDDSESGLNGVTVSLLNLEDESVIASAVSDSSGLYSISAYLPEQCDGPNDNVALGVTLSVTKNCLIDHAGGFHYITFTTSTDCSAISGTITLYDGNGSTLYTDHCGSGGSLTDGESVTVGPFTEPWAGTASLNFASTAYSPITPAESDLGGFSNISWRYARYWLEVSDLPSGFVFSLQDVGDNSDGSESVDSDCNSDGIVYAGPVDERVLSSLTDNNFDCGAYYVGNGTLQFHIFTDTNGNGSQNSGEADNYIGATLTIAQGSETQDVDFDADGNINSTMAVGTYVLSVNAPSGYTVTGGSNHILVTITAGEIFDAGSRGITTASSGGGGHGSGGSSGSVNYGSRGSSSHGSSTTYSGSSSSSPSSHASNSVVPSNDLPTPQSHRPACLTVGHSAISFSDVNENEDLTFLTGLTFFDTTDHHLIHGYGDNTFGPDHLLTRFELLKIALGSNCIGGGNGAVFSHPNSYFSDVPQDNSEESLIIGEAYNRGFIHGVGNHFYPDNPVSLGETIKMLVGSSSYFSNGQPIQNFSITVQGVSDPSFIQPVEYARQLNILPSTIFSQDSLVNRLAMARMVARFIRSMASVVMVE